MADVAVFKVELLQIQKSEGMEIVLRYGETVELCGRCQMQSIPRRAVETESSDGIRIDSLLLASLSPMKVMN